MCWCGTSSGGGGSAAAVNYAATNAAEERAFDLPPVDVPIKSGSPGLKVNRWDGDGLMGSELHRQRAGDAARRSEPVACVPGYCAA